MSNQVIITNEYISASVKYLLCSHKNKIRFIKSTKVRIQNYFDENPDSTYTDLEKSFGTPDMMANDFMESIDADEIRRAKSFKIYRSRIQHIMVPVLLLVIICLVYAFLTKPEVQVSTTVYESGPMPDKYVSTISDGETIRENTK